MATDNIARALAKRKKGGTSDYESLSNKPQINGINLTGNKTSEDLGLVDETSLNGTLDDALNSYDEKIKEFINSKKTTYPVYIYDSETGMEQNIDPFTNVAYKDEPKTGQIAVMYNATTTTTTEATEETGYVNDNGDPCINRENGILWNLRLKSIEQTYMNANYDDCLILVYSEEFGYIAITYLYNCDAEFLRIWELGKDGQGYNYIENSGYGWEEYNSSDPISQEFRDALLSEDGITLVKENEKDFEETSLAWAFEYVANQPDSPLVYGTDFRKAFELTYSKKTETTVAKTTYDNVLYTYDSEKWNPLQTGGDYATKDFVNEKIADLIGGAPETLDTLKEIADKLKDDEDVAASLLSEISKKADSETVADLQESINGKADLTYLNNQIGIIDKEIENIESKSDYPTYIFDSVDGMNNLINPVTNKRYKNEPVQGQFGIIPVTEEKEVHYNGIKDIKINGTRLNEAQKYKLTFSNGKYVPDTNGQSYSYAVLTEKYQLDISLDNTNTFTITGILKSDKTKTFHYKYGENTNNVWTLTDSNLDNDPVGIDFENGFFVYGAYCEDTPIPDNNGIFIITSQENKVLNVTDGKDYYVRINFVKDGFSEPTGGVYASAFNVILDGTTHDFVFASTPEYTSSGVIALMIDNDNIEYQYNGNTGVWDYVTTSRSRLTTEQENIVFGIDGFKATTTTLPDWLQSAQPLTFISAPIYVSEDNIVDENIVKETVKYCDTYNAVVDDEGVLSWVKVPYVTQETTEQIVEQKIIDSTLNYSTYIFDSVDDMNNLYMPSTTERYPNEPVSGQLGIIPSSTQSVTVSKPVKLDNVPIRPDYQTDYTFAGIKISVNEDDMRDLSSKFYEISIGSGCDLMIGYIKITNRYGIDVWGVSTHIINPSIIFDDMVGGIYAATYDFTEKKFKDTTIDYLGLDKDILMINGYSEVKSLITENPYGIWESFMNGTPLFEDHCEDGFNFNISLMDFKTGFSPEIPEEDRATELPKFISLYKYEPTEVKVIDSYDFYNALVDETGKVTWKEYEKTDIAPLTDKIDEVSDKLDTVESNYKLGDSNLLTKINNVETTLGTIEDEISSINTSGATSSNVDYKCKGYNTVNKVWELGSINSTGTLISSSTIARTAYITFPETYIKVKVRTGYKFRYARLTGTNFGFNTTWSSVTDSTVALAANSQYMFFVAKTNDGALSLDTLPEDALTFYYAENPELVKLQDNVQKFASEHGYINDANNFSLWEQGTISNAGANATSNARIRTIGYIPDEVDRIVARDGWSFAVFYYEPDTDKFLFMSATLTDFDVRETTKKLRIAAIPPTLNSVAIHNVNSNNIAFLYNKNNSITLEKTQNEHSDYLDTMYNIKAGMGFTMLDDRLTQYAHNYLNSHSEETRSIDEIKEWLLNRDNCTYRSKLQKIGNKLCDKDGNTFEIRALGTHHMIEFASCQTEECLRALKYYGVNCIRMTAYVGTKLYAHTNNVIDKGYIDAPEETKAAMDSIIQACINLGLYCVVDWHVLDSDGDINQYSTQGQEFFTYFLNKWSAYPNVLYELLNEPFANTAESMVNFCKTCTDLIRSYNPDAIIVVGKCKDYPATMKTVFDAAGITDIFYSEHWYVATSTLETDAQITAFVNNIKNNYVDKLPYICTEWGNAAASGDGALNDKCYQALTKMFHENKVSQMLWKLTYQDMTTSILKYSDAAFYDGLYKYGGFGKYDLSHNGELYLTNYTNYAFSDVQS